MVQYITPAPSFNTLLAQHLGSAIGNIGQGYLEGQQQKQRRAGTSTLLQQYGITPEQADQIAKSGIEARDILAHAEKLTPQGQQRQDQTQNVFNEMASLLASNAPGIGIAPFTAIGTSPKGAENRAYFDTMRARFEAALLPLVNKGALSKERFNYILSNIPKASDRQRVIYGKLKALANDLNLDPSALQNVPFAEEDRTGMSSKKIPSSSFAKPSSGYVLVQPPDGSDPVQIPRSELKKAQAAGGKVIK